MLEVEGIHTYYAHSHVLHGAALTVAPGEGVALLGRNGAGKTTLIRSIVGFTPPRAGTVRFEGTVIAGWPPHRIVRRGLALVPQGRRIFAPLTVRENLLLGARPGPFSLARALDLFPRLGERADQLGGTLSGGEQQMLAIARALLTHRRLLLLDAPSEGLAPLLVPQIARIVRRRAPRAGGAGRPRLARPRPGRPRDDPRLQRRHRAEGPERGPPHHQGLPRRADHRAREALPALRPLHREAGAARPALADPRGDGADGLRRSGARPPRRGGAPRHPARPRQGRDHGAGRVPPPRLRESRPRAPRRRGRPRGGAGHGREPLRRRLAGHARVRAHLDDGRQRLRHDGRARLPRAARAGPRRPRLPRASLRHAVGR